MVRLTVCNNTQTIFLKIDDDDDDDDGSGGSGCVRQMYLMAFRR